MKLDPKDRSCGILANLKCFFFQNQGIPRNMNEIMLRLPPWEELQGCVARFSTCGKFIVTTDSRSALER